MKRRLFGWFRRLVITVVLLLPVLYWASRTETPPLPPGVTKQFLHPTLAGREVSVTMYYPANRAEAPLVVVAHGFTRSKRYMAGWGIALAREGFIAAVPTQPALANHELNARALAELAAQLRDGRIALKVKCNGHVGLMGHSMGGLTTLLAAGRQPVDSWVGLDPVGMDQSWLKVGKSLKIPCAVLRAEPGAWNMNGNARDLFAVLPGPKWSLKVKGSTHLDLESPTDLLGQIACGRADEKRRALFMRYAIAFLKATLMSDAEARKVIDSASGDSALTEIEK